jgi:2-keto-3-deoxy-L-rhamnonate aldolase RhmA
MPALPALPRQPVALTQKLRDGKTVCVASCNPAGYTPDLVDYLGPTGLDGVWIETEHGTPDFQEIANLSRAADLWGMASVVRIHENDAGLIARVLDCGASGIVVPHVSTKGEAERVVQAGRFAPVGMRGMYGGRRAYGVDDYYHQANDEVCLVVLIEEQEALSNLDEILTVDGIDVFQVAPSDLAQTLGHIGHAEHPDVQAAIDGALGKIMAAGRTAGMVTSETNRERYMEMGVRFVYGSILRYLRHGAAEFRRAVDARNP